MRVQIFGSNVLVVGWLAIRASRYISVTVDCCFAPPQKLERCATVVQGAEGSRGLARSVAPVACLTRLELSGVRLQRRSNEGRRSALRRLHCYQCQKELTLLVLLTNRRHNYRNNLAARLNPHALLTESCTGEVLGRAASELPGGYEFVLIWRARVTPVPNENSAQPTSGAIP